MQPMRGIGSGKNMTDKQILVLGTAARGGIRSVIEAYETGGFYTPGHARFIATHVEGGMAQRLATAAHAYALVAWKLLTGRVALLHMHMSMRGSFWRKYLFLGMARLSGVPAIIHLHGSEFAVFYQGSSPKVQRAVRSLFNRASGVVVLSASWRDFIAGLTDNPVTIIGNFVPDRYDAKRAASSRRLRDVLFMGQFGERKGIYDLLPAFVEVRRRIPEARLFCGGNGEVDKVRDVVKQLGMEDAIQVPGWVSGDQKMDLLQGCGVFVLPSYNEGLPMAIIEAMSFSMAVVSTTVGGIPELVDSTNGALVTPGNREQLTAAIIDVLERDDIALQKLGTASRCRFEDGFSSTACMQDMKTLYQSLGVLP
jgi:glycosyltransferase involved in cell wall biosynthesis